MSERYIAFELDEGMTAKAMLDAIAMMSRVLDRSLTDASRFVRFESATPRGLAIVWDDPDEVDGLSD